jgi:periplasmic copper chaperone A
MRNSLIALALCLPALPHAAEAHVALQEPQAQAGSKYIARFRVGHGCSGAPTTALTIQLPPGVTDAAPFQQGGWTMATVRNANRITMVTWKGGSIPADKPGDFNIAMTLPRQAGVLAFPAVQSCGTTELAWTGIAAREGDKPGQPAPLLTLVAQGDIPAAAAPPPAMLTIRDAWFRALPAGLPAGGYFTLRNGRAQKAVLTGAQSSACGMLMLHQSSSTGGTSSMAHVTSVDVPAGGSIAFAPNGYHLMCMEPKPAMKPGGAVPVTLLFQGGGKLTANFAVRNAAGR